MDPRCWALGRANRASVVDRAGLRGGRRRPDGGRYAVYMADANTALHRLTASGAVGTVTLNAEAVEERLRDQLERREVTMAKIRADYARYCK